MRRTPGQNPNLHAPRQSAGYSRGAVIGDGARARYRPPVVVEEVDRPCEHCRVSRANCYVPHVLDVRLTRPDLPMLHLCEACAYSENQRRERARATSPRNG